MIPVTAEQDMGDVGVASFEREGEPLANALADARRKVTIFRRQAHIATQEAEKWQEIADKLLDAQNLSKRAPGEIKRAAPAVPGISERKPRGFWSEQIRIALSNWAEAMGPSKRRLTKLVMEANPGACEPAIMHALNVAIDTGKILFKGPDCLYLPERVPSAA